jgi:hypothetical protein
MHGKFVSYLRVSTDRQGRSGLGLESQRQAVADFLNGGAWQLVAEFVEVEAGKNADRPQLSKALQHCRLTGSTLVVAKLDRLARNARFLLAVVEGTGEAGVVFCDLPTMRCPCVYPSDRHSGLSAMTEWRVYLNGSKQSLDFLTKADGAEWSVCRDAERFYLTSHRWKEPTAGAEAHAFAERLCDHINLVMSFLTAATTHWKAVTIAAVNLVNDLGEVIHRFVWSDLVLPIEWAAEKPTASEEPPPNIGLLAGALEGSPDLVEAIRLLRQHGDNWTQLCKVIELAQTAHDGAIPSTWVSKTKIRDLKHTAQFRETAGETARHISVGNGTPPRHPIPLPEAQTIVRLIVLKWLYGLVRDD